MSVIYQIQVLSLGRDDWLAELESAVARELIDIGMHTTVSVDLTTSEPNSLLPAVTVVLVGDGGRSAGNAHVVEGFITQAQEAGRVIIPVVEDLANYQQVVPKKLSEYNGFEWSGDIPSTSLARILLEELGIEEQDRRVFISHKRSDGLWAAEELHDALSHNRFAPFIDRFLIPKGADVQRHIADALEGYAFLLLLETPDAHLSEWVFDEVDYALSHTMGVLIVEWPNGPAMLPGSAGIPRIRLDAGDVVKNVHGADVLTEDAVDRIIREVEHAHARALVRRRRMLVRNVEEAARACGANFVALKDWSIDVSNASERWIVGVTPRLPSARELQRLDEVRGAVDASAGAILVHAARQLPDDTRLHLEWAIGSRSLELIPDNSIGGRW